MAIRPILEFPHPVLRQKAARITVFNERLAELVKDMTETMYDAPGIGLAAPQIGESIQLIVVDIARLEQQQEVMVMINPVIIAQEGSQIDEEGCLSVIDLIANVTRYQKITVAFQDLSGVARVISTEDRFAVVLQHEIDHLHGILFLDHLSALKRTLYKKKVKKILADNKA
jgi:peptide deformylase